MLLYRQTTSHTHTHYTPIIHRHTHKACCRSRGIYMIDWQPPLPIKSQMCIYTKHKPSQMREYHSYARGQMYVAATNIWATLVHITLHKKQIQYHCIENIEVSRWGRKSRQHSTEATTKTHMTLHGFLSLPVPFTCKWCQLAICQYAVMV